ncbi:MAG: hypothetical protein U9N41_05025 [Euryarchaeota archaeon]|nr:hypothetical protein [Euryarchaeota archaeon]
MKKKWRYFVVIGKEGELIKLPEHETEEERERGRKLKLRRERREILKGTAMLNALKEMEDRNCLRGILDKKRLKHLRRRFLKSEPIKMGMSKERRGRIEYKVAKAGIYSRKEAMKRIVEKKKNKEGEMANRDKHLKEKEKELFIIVGREGKVSAKVLDIEDIKRKLNV